MDAENVILVFSDESDQELFEAGVFDSDDDSDQSIQTIRVYTRKNHMVLLCDMDFVYRFRLSKTSVMSILNEIAPHLRRNSRNHGIEPLHQLLLSLRFYALGTMLLSVADFIGVSKASASRIVADVSQAIARLYPNYIKVFDNTEEGFYRIAGLPKVLAAIDGTHVPIQSPDSNIAEQFRNRKGYFSLNVQGMCNAELLFMDVVARWPGSSHDATIFNSSAIKTQCENRIHGNRWLLGDSAYPCTFYLLTPLLNPRTPAEHRYNRAHITTRNTIERCFGVWKRRFPVLSLKLRLSLPTAQAVITATAVLHNICRSNNIAEVEPEPEMPIDLQVGDDVVYADDYNNTTRQELIENYFQ